MRKLSLIVVIAASACESEPAPTQTPEPAPIPFSGTRPHAMANCPSALPGAVTRLEPTSDGIDLVVTSEDAAVRQRIIELAEFHARADSIILPIPHTGLRGTTGSVGFCPIVHDGTEVNALVVPGGVRIEVKAVLPGGVKRLQDITTARASRIQGFVSS
jgi:hypothetical protein